MEKIRPLSSHNSVFPVQDELNDRFKLINKNFEILSAVAGQNGGNLDNLVTSVNGQTGDVTIQTGARPNEELTGVVTLNGEPIATQSWVQGKIIPPVRYARATTLSDGLMSADDKRKLDVLDVAQLMNSPSDVRTVNGMKGNVRITAESLGAATRVDPTFTGTVNVPTLDASDGNLRFDNRAASIKFVKQYFVRASAEVTDSLENATNLKAGLMSPEDKSKLDRLPEGGAQSAVVSVNSKTGAVQLEVDDIPGAAPIEEPHFRRAAFVDGKKVATEEMVNSVSARDRGAIKDAIMSDLNNRLVTDNQNGLMDSTSFKKLSDLPDPKRVITRINGIEATGRTNTVTLTPDDIGAVSRANPRMDSEPAIANVRLSDWIRENISVSRITAGLMSPADKRKLDSLSVTQEFSGDMKGNRVTNLGTPESVNDAATKAYVDTAKQGAIDESRRSVEEAKFNLESAIREAKETGADARAEADKANRSVRSLEAKASTAETGISDLKSRMTTLEGRANNPGVVSFDGNMAGKKITNLAVPENDRDGANKAYVDSKHDAAINVAKQYTDSAKRSIESEVSSVQSTIGNLSGRIDTLEARQDRDTVYDDTELKRRVKTLEDKPGYDDSGVKQRIQALETKTDKDTVYDDSDLKRRVTALEGRPAGQRYDDTALAGRVTALENKTDKDTVYDDTALKGRVSALETTSTDLTGRVRELESKAPVASGEAFTGDMKGRAITHLAAPSEDTDGANKAYVDQQRDAAVETAKSYTDGVKSALEPTIAEAKKAGTDAMERADAAHTQLSGISAKVTALEGKPSEAFTGDMKGGKISNLADPTAEKDAATMKYVDAEVKKVGVAAATVSSKHAKDLKDELAPQITEAKQAASGASTKVDGIVSRVSTLETDVAGLKAGGGGAGGGGGAAPFTGNMENRKIINLAAPETEFDATNKGYVDGIRSELIASVADAKKAGTDARTEADKANTAITDIQSTVSTLTGKVSTLEGKQIPEAFTGDLKNAKLTNVALPENATDGATKGYVDTEVAKVDAKISQATTKSGETEGKVSVLEGKVSDSAQKIEAAEGKIRTAEDRLDTVEGKVNGLETKVSGLDTAVKELKASGYDDTEIKRRVTALETKEDKDTVYDDSGIKARLTTLEAKPGYDDSEVKRRLTDAETAIGAKADSTALASTNSDVTALTVRVTNLEAKPDKDTVYDDSDLKRRVSVLEANGGGGGGGAYNDSELRNRINALEKKEDRDTVYNDAELRGRVQALESKEDKDTVYNDTELKGRVAAVESAVATKAEASALQTEAEKITALTTRVKAVEDRPAGGGAAPDLSGYMQKSEFERYFRDSTTSTLEPVYAKKSDISTFINSSALDQAMLGIPRMIGYVRYTNVQAGAWENGASLVPIGTYQRTDVGSLDFSWPALDPKDNLLVILPRQGAYLFQIIPVSKSDTLVYLHDGQGSFDGMVGPISSANAVAMGTGIQFIGAVNGPNKLARIPLATPGNTRKPIGDLVIMITFLGERR
nr:MAG TPA: tail fiber-like protein [Caudoviricetes sp.]